MQKEVVYRLGSWRTKVAEVPPIYEAENGKKYSVNDLNEALYYLGKEKVLEIILNAKDSPVPGVIDFSDIQDVDLDQIDGITTGIRPLDRYLMKLFQGTLNIITGINGAGKSSFINQIICQSLEQDKNVFLFSGELPNFQTKTGSTLCLQASATSKSGIGRMLLTIRFLQRQNGKLMSFIVAVCISTRTDDPTV